MDLFTPFSEYPYYHVKGFFLTENGEIFKGLHGVQSDYDRNIGIRENVENSNLFPLKHILNYEWFPVRLLTK